ncbi:MAG: hypothetical protein B1H04_01365 [Planctomycetales bacterium 4484_123]|nr:MAG: hypothetical protein B1H04_01365 [Planctomycetales bacterium 4484_123]
MPPGAAPIRRPPPELAFETPSLPRRLLSRYLVNPVANCIPAGLLRALLRFAKSQLAEANWIEPGGWRSMVISYNGCCQQVADRILVNAGIVPMALRNRKRLAAHLIAKLIEQSGARTPHVLCLGAGPGWIVMDALAQTHTPARATLVDLSAEALAFGRRLASERGLEGRVEFIQADIRQLDGQPIDPPDLVKMVGICEYLSDEQVVAAAREVGRMMRPGKPIIFSSVSCTHGAEPFLRRVLGLHLTYRSPVAACRLAGRAGFGDFEVYPEPLGVYHVIVGRRRCGAGA